MAEKVYWEIKENHVDEVIEASKKAITAAAKAVGVQAVSHAVTNITSQGAVDTGLLRNSLTFAIGGQGTKKKSYSGKKSKYTGKVPESGGYDQTFPADEDGKRTVYIGTNVYYAPLNLQAAPCSNAWMNN